MAIETLKDHRMRQHVDMELARFALRGDDFARGGEIALMRLKGLFLLDENEAEEMERTRREMFG